MGWNVEIDRLIQEFSGDWFEYWDDRLDEFICLVDRKRVTRYVSFGVENVIGFTPEELIGTKAFRIMDESTSKDAHAFFEKFIQSKGESLEFQYESWTKKGKPVMLHGKSFPVFRDEKSLGMITVIQRLSRAKQFPSVFESYSNMVKRMAKGEEF